MSLKLDLNLNDLFDFIDLFNLARHIFARFDNLMPRLMFIYSRCYDEKEQICHLSRTITEEINF